MVAHPYCLRSVSQQIGDPSAQGWSKAQKLCMEVIMMLNTELHIYCPDGSGLYGKGVQCQLWGINCDSMQTIVNPVCQVVKK